METPMPLMLCGCCDMGALIVDAVAAELDTVQVFIENALKDGGCPQKVINQIAIAVEEIFVNIVSYAYPTPNTHSAFDMSGESKQTGYVRIRVTGGKPFSIEFADAGIPYNPLKKCDPDISVPLEKRRIGGMGIYMAKNIMDDMEYRYENNNNILTIRKSF